MVVTRRRWRRQGVGAALPAAALVPVSERSENGVGLVVDTASETRAIRLYEGAGMAPAPGRVVYEKKLSNAAFA